MLRDSVREHIREAIWNGDLRPGDHIVETLWAKRLGTSQTHLREALRGLEQMSLVETYPRRGSFVTRLSVQSIRDLFDLRTNLEQFAARHALRRGDGSLLQRLRSLAVEMRCQRGEDRVAALVTLSLDSGYNGTYRMIRLDITDRPRKLRGRSSQVE